MPAAKPHRHPAPKHRANTLRVRAALVFGLALSAGLSGVSFWAAQPASAQRNVSSEFVPTFSTSTRVKQQMERLERLASQKLWDEWLTTYQGLVDDPSDAVIERDAEFLIGVRYTAHQQLAAMPAAVRTRYRARFDLDARKLFDKASAEGDAVKVREVYSRYRFSSYGPRALLWMADRALDEGRPELARVAYGRIVKDPGVSVSTLLRYALASEGAGHPAEARSALERVKREFAAQPVQLAGQATSGGAAADRLLKEMRKEALGTGTGPRWTRFGGEGQRRMSSKLPLTGGLTKLWELPYSTSAESAGTPGRFTVNSPGSRTRFSFLSFPVLAEGQLWLQGPRSLTRMDLSAGKAMWDRQGADFVLLREEVPTAVAQPTRFGGSSRSSLRVIQAAPTLDGKRLVTRLPLASPEGSGFQTFPQDFGIAVHDATTGAMLWRRVAGGDPRGVFWNSPAVEANMIFTGYWSEKGGIWEYTAVALDAATGETLWSTYLGAGSDPFSGTDGSPAVVKDGVVWIESTLYTLNALDLLSGEVRLIYRYDPSRRSMPRGGGFDSGGSLSNEPFSLTAAGSGPIVFCPRWGLDVVALDPTKGTLLWSSPKGFGTPNSGVVFGVDAKQVYVAGEHLQSISLENGAPGWTWEPSGSGSAGGIGFPALAGDQIFTLTDGKLVVRSTADGKEVTSVDLSASLGDQPGYATLTVSEGLLLVATRDRLVAFGPK